MEKQKRSDRAKKLLERKTRCETAVKCCLRRRIHGDGETKDKVIEAIQERVLGYSKRVHLASIALNLLVRECFDGVPDDQIPLVYVPDFLEQTFIRQLLLGTEYAIKPVQEVYSLYTRYPILFDKLKSLPRHSADRNIMSSGTTKYITNLKNHLVVNFPKLLRKWIYSGYVQQALKNVQNASTYLLFALQNWEWKEDVIDLPPTIQTQYLILKEILGADTVNDKWFTKPDNLYRIVRFYVFINRFLSNPNYTCGLEPKTYNLLPIARIKRHFIAIDTHSLYGLLKDCELIECSNKVFQLQGLEQWKAFFDYESVMGKGKQFTGTIETDGIAVCIHFTKPKEELIIELPKLDRNNPNLEVVGVDPGRTNIYYAVKVDDLGNPKTFKLTRSHYYKASGTIKANTNVRKWNDPIQPEITLLSLNSPKVLEVERFMDYVMTVLTVYETVWNEWTKKRWSDQRLRLYGGKKRVFAQFWNKVSTPGKKTVVAFGSAKFAPGGKSEVSVPTTRAFKECSNRFQTFAVDEFRTSKIYWKDQQTVLQTVKRMDKNEVVRGLLWCSSTNQERSKLINRDFNAAMNIRNCLLATERPRILQRSGAPRLVQRPMAFLKF